MKTPSLHLAVGYATVVAMVPYLVLKLAWVLGSDIGSTEPGLMHSTPFVVGNLLTAAMELVAVALVLTLVHQWGRRTPAWSVLLPVWVASGLLGPVMLAAPLAFVGQSVLGTTGDPSSGGNLLSGLHGWVYGVVYAGFFVQGTGLAVAFVLHVRARWGSILTGRLDAVRSATHEVQVLTTVAATGLAVLVVAVRLYWAAGGQAGLPDARRTLSQQMLDASSAALALVGVLGLIALVFGSPRGLRVRVPLAAAWLGSGAMVWSGAYQIVILLAPGTPFDSANGGGSALVLVAQLIGGLLAATTGAFQLAERASLAEPVVAADQPVQPARRSQLAVSAQIGAGPR